MDGKNGGGGGSHLEDSLRLLFLLYIKVKFDSVLKRCRGRKGGEADTFLLLPFSCQCARILFSALLILIFHLKAQQIFQSF